MSSKIIRIPADIPLSVIHEAIKLHEGPTLSRLQLMRKHESDRALKIANKLFQEGHLMPGHIGQAAKIIQTELMAS